MKCSKCQIEKSETEFYASLKTRRHTYCKQCNKEYTKNKLRSTKIKAIEYKGGKCMICSYDRCNEALDFHHIDPSKKEFTISHTSKNFENIKSELDKCILVCANCHREIHGGLIDLNKTGIPIPN